MNKMKGITLISLVITIVILIILTTVIVNLSLGNNGIFNRTKTAKEQYTNSQQDEENQISDMEAQVEMNSRESITISKAEYDSIINRLETLESKTNFDNPKLIATINKSYNSSTFAQGTYYTKSSNIFSKSIQEVGNEYIEFISNQGFKLKKDGYYLICSTMGADVYNNTWGRISSGLIIDDSTNIDLTQSIVSAGVGEDRQINSTTLYLKKDTIIDFYLQTNATTTYCGGVINIYSLS